MSEVRTYGGWRRPETRGIFGLGTFFTLLLFVGLMVLVLLVMLNRLDLVLVAVPVMAGIGWMLILKDKHSQSLATRTTRRVQWGFARLVGANRYWSGPLGRSPWRRCQLPGVAAATRLSEHTDSYNRPFAVIHHPGVNTCTVVLGANPEGAALVDRLQIDTWVDNWGFWLARLADETDLQAATVTIETAPDSGSEVKQQVLANRSDTAPEFASRVMDEVISANPAGRSKITGTVALTFRVGGGTAGALEARVRDIAARLPALTEPLNGTGAGPTTPLTAQEISELVRVAYDPAIAPWLAEVRAMGQNPDFSWTDSGPVRTETTWEAYKHDSGVSASWVMSQAPLGLVQDRVLQRFLAPHRDVARKRVTLLYQPIDSATAAAIVESDQNNAVYNSSTKRKPTASDTQRIKFAAQTAREEAAGAALMNFALLATATVLDEEDLPAAIAAMESTSVTARIRLRRAFGAQDSTFAAALPIGIISSAYLRLPQEIRRLM